MAFSSIFLSEVTLVPLLHPFFGLGLVVLAIDIKSISQLRLTTSHMRIGGTDFCNPLVVGQHSAMGASLLDWQEQWLVLKML